MFVLNKPSDIFWHIKFPENLLSGSLGLAVLEVAGRQPVCWPNILEVMSQVRVRLGSSLLPAALRLTWNSWIQFASPSVPVVPVGQKNSTHRVDSVG